MVRLLIMIVACISASATAVASDNVPRRKSGLWSMSVITPGLSAPMTMQQCVDEKTDDLTATLDEQTKQACKSQMKPDGNRIVFDSTCKVGASTATTRGVLVGDLKSSYTHESTTTFSPPMAGMKEGVTKVAAQWTGPCTAGMKAGDVVMSNGTKFNLNDFKSLKKK